MTAHPVLALVSLCRIAGPMVLLYLVANVVIVLSSFSPTGSPPIFVLLFTAFKLAGLPRDFDLVVMSHVLEHMLDPVAALQSALEVLRPGGHLLLAVPNPVRPSVFLASLLRREYVNRGHVVAWDRAHWINFLERILALEVVRYASDSVPVFPERWKRRIGLLGRCEEWLVGPFPWLSFSNIAVVRKAAAAPCPGT